MPTAPPAAAPGSVSLHDFVDDYVFRYRHSTFPVTDEEGHPSGLVTLNRVRQVPRSQWSDTQVRDIACTGDDLATAPSDEPLADVLGRMSRCADGRLVVIDDGRLTGVVSPADVTRRLEIAELRRATEDEHL